MVIVLVDTFHAELDLEKELDPFLFIWLDMLQVPTQ